MKLIKVECIKFEDGTIVPLSELDGYAIGKLIIKHPSLIDKVDISKMNGYDWSRLLYSRPSFINVANKELISEIQWEYILKKQPKLKKYV